MSMHFVIGEREYQEIDVPWFLDNPRSLILYEPRMGKTVVAVKVMAKDPRTRIVLIVCSKNAINVWQDHIDGMWPQLAPDRSYEVRLVKGGKNPSKAKALRDAEWKRVRTSDVTFYIVTYGSLEKDWEKLRIMFDTVICDEFHLRMLNRKNKTVSMIRSLSRPATAHRVHLLSGTPTRKKGPADFWAVFNILAPGRFTSYWNFVYTHMEVNDGRYGKEILGILDVKRWHNVLDSMSRRRFRAIDAPHIPAVQRTPRWFELTPSQRAVYDQFASEDFLWVGDELIVAQNSLEKATRFRQLLSCPAMLDPSYGVGGAMERIIERLTDDDATEEDKHTVIFTEFAQALPHFKAALNSAGFNHVYTLQGGMEPEDLAHAIKRYRESRGIILCSIKYAQAFSLEPAKESHFIGFSWDPNDNKQAEDRLLPQQGVNPILANYYAARDTKDADLMDAVHFYNTGECKEVP
jgi:hypothetical protein